MTLRFLVLLLFLAFNGSGAETWKVWYDDGVAGLQQFHSSTDAWSDIPDAAGLQIVLICESTTQGSLYSGRSFTPGLTYRRIMHGSDWYWIEDGTVKQDAQVGVSPLREKPTRAGRTGFKSGKNIGDITFESYRTAALADTSCSVP